MHRTHHGLDEHGEESADNKAAASLQTGADLVVRVEDLYKSYGRRHNTVQALRAISLDVRRGEFLVLLGPSGCGKTTLLRSIAGLLFPTRGRVELLDSVVYDSEDRVFVPPNRRNIGMVFQQYALWPHMTVHRNVAFPLRVKKRKDLLRAGRVHDVLDLVQCGHLIDRYPTELSGGQQQRISLARALAPRPAVMLMDEPLSNLDALLRLELRAEIRRVHSELGFTAVYVTHDQAEALSLASRVVVMREGTIEQVGDPDDVYDHPVSEYVAEFLGARVQLDMQIGGHQREVLIEGQPVRHAHGGLLAPTPGAWSIRLRPHVLKLRSPRTGAVEADDGMVWLSGGEVAATLAGGETTEYVVQFGEKRLTLDAPRGLYAFRRGDAVDVGFDSAKAHVYSRDEAPASHATDGAPAAGQAQASARVSTE